MTADSAQFEAAHNVMVAMLTPLTKRKRNPLADKLPLLVFVTPEAQYHNWNHAQEYTVSASWANF